MDFVEIPSTWVAWASPSPRERAGRLAGTVIQRCTEHHLRNLLAPALAQQLAAVGFEMAKEIQPLHAAVMQSGSRSTS